MQPTMYWIGIRGRVTERLGSAFEGMRVEAGFADSVFTASLTACSLVKFATNHSRTGCSIGSVI